MNVAGSYGVKIIWNCFKLKSYIDFTLKFYYIYQQIHK